MRSNKVCSHKDMKDQVTIIITKMPQGNIFKSTHIAYNASPVFKLMFL